MASKRKNEGEGNRTAARVYNRAAERFAKSGRVQPQAERAKKHPLHPHARGWDWASFFRISRVSAVVPRSIGARLACLANSSSPEPALGSWAVWLTKPRTRRGLLRLLSTHPQTRPRSC